MEQASAEIRAADEAAGATASDFVVTLARALHQHGMPSHHLESLLGRVATRLELEAQMLSLPTAFIASFAEHDPSLPARTVILRLDPGGMDLTRQSKLILVGRRVADGTMAVAEALGRMAEVEREPGPSWWLPVVAGTVVAGAASRLFGGGLGEVIVGSAIGFFVVLVTRLVRGTRAQRLREPLAAVLAAVVASLGTRWVAAGSPTIAVLGSLMLLLPGYTFTVGLDELSARHWVAGTSRIAGALPMILFLGLSVLVANKLPVLARPILAFFTRQESGPGGDDGSGHRPPSGCGVRACLGQPFRNDSPWSSRSRHRVGCGGSRAGPDGGREAEDALSIRAGRFRTGAVSFPQNAASTNSKRRSNDCGASEGVQTASAARHAAPTAPPNSRLRRSAGVAE